MIKKIHKSLPYKLKQKHKQDNVHNMICIMSKIKGMMYKRVALEGPIVDGMVGGGIYQEWELRPDRSELRHLTPDSRREHAEHVDKQVQRL